MPADAVLATQFGLSFTPNFAVPVAAPCISSAKAPSNPPATRWIASPPLATQPVPAASKEGLPTQFCPGSTAATITGAEAEAVPPALSVTSTVAVQLPAA